MYYHCFHLQQSALSATVAEFLNFEAWYEWETIEFEFEYFIIGSFPGKPGSREAGERFDRAQWKAMQQIMSDTNKFLDMLQDIPWQEGLSLETISGWFRFGLQNLSHSS